MEEAEFYAAQSAVTDPGAFAALLGALPHDIRTLCDVVYGLVAHRDVVSQLHGYDPPVGRRLEPDTRYVRAILARIIEMDDRSLLHLRPPERRFMGSCRDFAVLLCAMLRHQGVPARLRCGFATYWLAGLFADHWVCEYWDEGEHGWRFADPEVGPREREVYGIAFDHTDVPHGQFLVAGAAWQQIRLGHDPDAFGVHHIGITGAWFVRANVLRDLASLNKIELLPWDYTPYFERSGKRVEDLAAEGDDGDLELLDRIADAMAANPVRFAEVVSLYHDHPDLQVRGAVKSYTIVGPHVVELT